LVVSPEIGTPRVSATALAHESFDGTVPLPTQVLAAPLHAVVVPVQALVPQLAVFRAPQLLGAVIMPQTLPSAFIREQKTLSSSGTQMH